MAHAPSTPTFRPRSSPPTPSYLNPAYNRKKEVELGVRPQPHRFPTPKKSEGPEHSSFLARRHSSASVGVGSRHMISARRPMTPATPLGRGRAGRVNCYPPHPINNQAVPKPPTLVAPPYATTSLKENTYGQKTVMKKMAPDQWTHKHEVESIGWMTAGREGGGMTEPLPQGRKWNSGYIDSAERVKGNRSHAFERHMFKPGPDNRKWYARPDSGKKIKERHWNKRFWGENAYGYEEPALHFRTTYDQLHSNVPAALDEKRHGRGKTIHRPPADVERLDKTFEIRTGQPQKPKFRQELQHGKRYHVLTGKENVLPVGPSDCFFPGKDNRRKCPVTGWTKMEQRTNLVESMQQPSPTWSYKDSVMKTFNTSIDPNKVPLRSTAITNIRDNWDRQGVLVNGRRPNFPGVI